MAQLVFPIRMFGLSHFRTEYKKAESLLSSQRQVYGLPQYVQRVHDLNYENNSTTEVEVDAICWRQF